MTIELFNFLAGLVLVLIHRLGARSFPDNRVQGIRLVSAARLPNSNLQDRMRHHEVPSAVTLGADQAKHCQGPSGALTWCSAIKARGDFAGGHAIGTRLNQQAEDFEPGILAKCCQCEEI
ncbi:hypothetical protein ABID19_005878 [Mesorhizobium robiniae]|uniref:Secreted protein n=1 Tax=Mesorhizobium robiniae TaxID=559315 RepID=A0ABV2GWZ1_9HYPH